MEPVLCYGVPFGCSFGSIIALEWLGQPYRLCRIKLPIDPNDEVFGRVNPDHFTPSLIMEDGEVLNENFAILHHIAARDPSKKLGFQQGTREFDRLNSVLGYLVASFHPLWFAQFSAYKLSDDPTVQDGMKAKARPRIIKGFDRIEAILGGKDWMAGDRRTIADAFLAGIARWGELTGIVDFKQSYPHLHKLMQKLEADEAVIFAHAIEEEKPAGTSGKFLGHVTLDELIPRLAA